MQSQIELADNQNLKSTSNSSDIPLDFKSRFNYEIERAVNFERYDLDSALYHYHEALSLAESVQFLSAQSQLYGKIGELHTQAKGGVLVSTEYFIRSYDLAFLSGDRFTIWAAVNKMGDVNRSRKHTSLAFKHYQAVLQDMEYHLDKSDQNAYKLLKFHCINDLALVYYGLDEHEKAKKVVQLVLSEATEEENYEIARTYQNLACFTMELEQYEEAENYLDSAAAIFNKETYPTNWIFLELDRVDMQLKSGDFGTTEQLLNEIEEVATSIGSEAGLYLTWKFKKNYYSRVKNLALEQLYTDLYLKQLDLIYSTENVLEISKILLDHEISYRDKRVVKTEQRNLLLKERTSNLRRTVILLSAGILTFTALLLFIIVLLRKQRKSNRLLVKKNLELVAANQPLQETSVNSKYATSKLEESKMQDLADRLKQLMEEKKIFLKQDLSLAIVSDQLKVNRTYLSQSINAVYGKNFNQLIAFYRVNEAIIKLSDSDNDKYSIAGIGELCGFGSTAAFNRVFKRETGVTPSVFRKNSY